jgi:arylsulfatase A-like enzyme
VSLTTRLAAIENADVHIKNLVTELETLLFFENTIVLYSDIEKKRIS